MTNREFAAVFNLIGDLLELKGENVFKISAYRKAADTILASKEDVETMWRENRVRQLPGIGEAIAAKINEMEQTGGRLRFLERLEDEIPPDLATLLRVPGIGAKTAMQLYKHLGIKGLGELEAAAREGRIATMPGMGQKKQDALLKSIEALHKRKEGRVLLSVGMRCGAELSEALRHSDPHVKDISPTGALRRGEETLEELSLVAATDDIAATLDTFGHLPVVEEVLSIAENRLTAQLHDGLTVELIVCVPDQFAATLLLTTGPTDFTQDLKQLAEKHIYSLEFNGLLKLGTAEPVQAPVQEPIQAPAQNEIEIFDQLGLPYLSPEVRSRTELAAVAQGKRPPELVKLSDLKGDLHSHSTWSDGTAPIETMARAAAERGYRYLLLTDHTKSLGMVRGLNEEKLVQQQVEIARINEVLQGEGFNFRLLSGAEVEIKADGSLDFEDEVLAQMDIVVASLHSSLRQECDKITERLLRAMHNPHVDIIAHPTGRIINAREPADLDMTQVFQAARETGTVLEINGGPDRLDLKAEHVQQALAEGVQLVISSDAHSTNGLGMVEYGVITARRGGAEACQILNTLELTELQARLKH